MEILADARATFDAAQAGYHDLVGSESWRRLPGLRNAIAQGRAVTNVLQNLRSVVPDFDEWYRPKVQEMQQEPMLAYVYPMRTELLKKGSTTVQGDSGISFELDRSKLGELSRSAPPNGQLEIGWTGATFSAAWHIRGADGSLRIEPAPLPGTVRGTPLHFPNAPTEFRGHKLDNSAANILSAYVGYMGELVSEAEKRWLTPGEIVAVHRRIELLHHPERR